MIHIGETILRQEPDGDTYILCHEDGKPTFIGDVVQNRFGVDGKVLGVRIESFLGGSITAVSVEFPSTRTDLSLINLGLKWFKI
jgi:hypothetical protein